jgi:uncharacterized membrane protein YciS (DUF1049 family)
MLRIAGLLALVFILGNFLYQFLVDAVFFLQLDLELKALGCFVLHQ